MAANPMQPWRVEAADVGSSSGFWPAPYSVGRPGDSGPGGPEPGPPSSSGYGPATAPPWLGVSRAGSLASGGGARGQQLAAYASVPSAATVGDDDDLDGSSERGGDGAHGAALELGGGKVDRHGSGVSAASLGPSSDRRGSSTTTIPEIASDAALAELRARIREDTMACRQFVAETEEQWQHLAALRKELEELSVTLSALHVKRHQTAAEAEEEERRVLDARRLRSQLKKGLHDAQKRVDGAGHRSRAALQQLQKLLGQASQFVSSEEEVANGGMPLAADADPSDLVVTSSALGGGGGLSRGGQGPGSAGDFDDSMSCVSDRYSVADDAMRVPSQPTGLVGQLLTWARGVLSIRFVLSLSEVSLTVSPGARRRRKRGIRGSQRLRGPPLHEISEAPDVGDEGGVAAQVAAEDTAGSLTQQPALRGNSLHAPGSPTRAVATAASAAAQAVAAVASVGANSSGGAPSGSGVSHAAVGSVHELSMRLAARAAAATGSLGGASEFGALRPSAFKSGAALSSSLPVGQGSGPNRFNRLVNMAQQEKQPGVGGGGGGVQAASAVRGVPSLQPARAAPQPPPGQQQAGAPLERRGSSDRQGRQPVEVSWPMTPLSHGISPQSSQERL